MSNVTEVVRLFDECITTNFNGSTKDIIKLLKPIDVFIDDIGIGRGVTDRLIELGYQVNAVNVGMTATEPEFKNSKAEYYWNAIQWIKQGGKLVASEKWVQLSWIKYKISSDKVLQIEPKDELKKRTGKSPDHAESFMLTFARCTPYADIRFI